MNEILVSINASGKPRIAKIWYEFDNPVYTIHRVTYQFGGKQTVQPIITIAAGKCKRTVLEQTQLQFNSEVKRYLDKGYKRYTELSNEPFDDVDMETLQSLFGDTKTDQSGVIKPMLAKDCNKCSPNVFERYKWLASRKINGVRALMYYNYEANTVLTASRGGGDYNISTQHITQMDNIQNLLRNNLTCILDGELYKHGLSLQQLSGMARKETEAQTDLEFWIYDIYDSENPDMSFEERHNLLLKLEAEYFGTHPFDPLDNNKVKFVPHESVNSTYIAVSRLHDKYVNEGFEGVVIRDVKGPYGVGKRDNRMLKVKKYQDAEFTIKDYRKVLRDVDFVFVLETEDGKEFEASPMGSWDVRREYLDTMDELKGKKATVKFFDYSDAGIPSQPKLVHIRKDDE